MNTLRLCLTEQAVNEGAQEMRREDCKELKRNLLLTRVERLP